MCASRYDDGGMILGEKSAVIADMITLGGRSNLQFLNWTFVQYSLANLRRAVIVLN